MLQQLVLQIFDLPRMRQDRGLNASWVSNKLRIQSIRTNVFPVVASIHYSKSGNTSAFAGYLPISREDFFRRISKIDSKTPRSQ